MDEAQTLTVVERAAWSGDLLVVPVSSEEMKGGLAEDLGDIALVEEDGQPVQVRVYLGPREKLTAERARKAGGALGKWLVKRNLAQAAVETQSLENLDIPGALEAFFEGALLGSFRFDRHKSNQKSRGQPALLALADANAASLEDRLARISLVTKAVNLARALAHEPPNVVNPETLSERAQALAAESGLECEILDNVRLAEMGAGALVAVGQGSQTGSRLIVLKYAGQNAGNNPPVALVGKAITFDTGGYTIKDRAGMVGMKYDKSGGMTVMAILKAAADLRIPTPVVGVVAAAENMISAEAYRPNDILTTLSGKTVEVISADAEGRLVLSDALTYAQRTFRPRALIDLATLTGGVVTSLGTLRAGLMSNDDTLAQSLIESGEQTHELLWRLPLDDEYFELIQGDDSDFKNSSSRREALAIVGGIFLKQFVEEGTPWAHIDIAGMAVSERDLAYSPKGATGYGVRLLIDYLEKL